jgi:hypothetical protein
MLWAVAAGVHCDFIRSWQEPKIHYRICKCGGCSSFASGVTFMLWNPKDGK